MNKRNEHINWCRVALFVLCWLFMSTSMTYAQLRKVMNRPYIDQRQFHYGFYVGTHVQDLEFQNNGFVGENGDQWFADVPNYDPGVSVGILGEYNLHPHIALRVLPSIHFGEKQIMYKNMLNGSHELQSMKSTYIAAPINLKFTAERFNNYRPFVVAGVNPMFDLTSKKQRNLKLKQYDMQLEVGFGCDFYLPFFKLIPEIKFGYGLLNMVDKNITDLTDDSKLIFTKSVDNARSRMIIFSLYFE